jgi:hypothetical protein
MQECHKRLRQGLSEGMRFQAFYDYEKVVRHHSAKGGETGTAWRTRSASKTEKRRRGSEATRIPLLRPSVP